MHSTVLRPRIPSDTRRYNDKNAAFPKSRQIPRASRFDRLEGDSHAVQPLTSVPEGWLEYVNPAEGQPFFYNAQQRVITDTYIRAPHVLARIQFCYAQITGKIANNDSVDNRLSSMDIYIELAESNSSSESCSYYLVDHSQQVICFPEEINTSEIGLPDVRNGIHLEHVLQAEYWTHSEYMPRPDVDMKASGEKLQAQLAALLIDNISSEGSTSPFTPEECKGYLEGLQNAKRPQILNWSIARINSLLLQSQIVNLYGEECARLDRSMVVTGQHASKRSQKYLALSRLMFNTPAIHLDQLERLWVERIIYTHHWRKLVSDILEEWAGALAAASVIWVSDAVLLSTASSLVVIVFLGLSTASVVFGAAKAVLLIRSHRAMGKFAAHGCQFLQSKEEYGTGLQSLSIEYSLPWVCVLWAGCFTSAAVFWILFTSLVSATATMVGMLGYAPTYILVTTVLGGLAWAYGKGYDPSSIWSPSRFRTYRIRS